MFKVLYGLLWLMTWLPLRLLYIISDISYPIIYYIVRYRRNVVKTNLAKSFPEKSEKERRNIERRFYHYFCDIFVETMYEMHMSKNEILRRFNLGNYEPIVEQVRNGKSVMLMTAHYCNWEWASAVSLILPTDNKMHNIYKKLRNKKFDTLMLELRSKFTGKNTEKKDLLRTMVNMKNEGKVAVFGMIADQSPTGKSAHYWTTFLNQDTPVLLGTEQLAKKFNYPVFYIHINRIKRGYYKCEFHAISLEPTLTAGHEITDAYMQILEKEIESAPEFWLWSHKRWKHSHN
ncbi:MAG: lysophospholipid acyltransferase family protein [Paludibacter sp.]|nr:lysophospholipid acyltransferase family protein [Paludibacter sp.]